MKRRYSPAARRAHLRAMHNRPSEVYIVEMDPKDPIAKLIESYEQGFLTAVELADLILETLPQPEPAPLPPDVLDPSEPFNPGYYGPERPDDWTPEAEETCSHLNCNNPTQPGYYWCEEHNAAAWAASLTPPSPPWEGGIA